jgi:hypothetical protein
MSSLATPEHTALARLAHDRARPVDAVMEDLVRATLAVVLPPDERIDRAFPGLGLSWRDLIRLLALQGARLQHAGQDETTWAQAVSALIDGLDQAVSARFRSLPTVVRAARSRLPDPDRRVRLLTIDTRQGVRAVLAIPPSSISAASLYGAEVTDAFPGLSPVPFLRRVPAATVPILVAFLERDGVVTPTLTVDPALGQVVTRLPALPPATEVVSALRFSTRPFGDGLVAVERSGRIVWHHDAEDLRAMQAMTPALDPAQVGLLRQDATLVVRLADAAAGLIA